MPSFDRIEQASMNLLVPVIKDSNLCALDLGIRYIPASIYFSLLSLREIRRTTSAGMQYFCATSLIEITSLLFFFFLLSTETKISANFCSFLSRYSFVQNPTISR